MKKLKENIDYYMKLKGINKYTDLLIDIAKHLGFQKDVEISAFIRNEKSNFSKMLQGKRPLKYEFITPLESIFGTSLSRILNEDAYRLTVDKGTIPFDKGFRYYAYIDDYDLYINEFDRKVDKEGKPIICNYDEYKKTFLDYIIEYGAKNGVRYLYDIYGISDKGYLYNLITFTKKRHFLLLHEEKRIIFARLVASMNDPDLFFNIFNSYEMFFSNGHYGGSFSIYNSNLYYTLLLENTLLFDKLFEIKHYEYKYIKREGINKIPKMISSDIPNPILNKCLNFALKHLDKYKTQAKKILEFGIKYNREIINKYSSIDVLLKINCIYHPQGDELGGILHRNNKDFISFLIMNFEDKIYDKEILSLINNLPKVNTY